MLLTLGVGAWSQTVRIEDVGDLSDDYFTRLTLVPIHVGLLGRQDWGMVSGWLGASGVLAPGVSFERFGEQPGFNRPIFLPPGILGYAGVSYRMAIGELLAEVRGVFLYRPGAGGLKKQVGGMVFFVGYRFVLD